MRRALSIFGMMVGGVLLLGMVSLAVTSAAPDSQVPTPTPTPYPDARPAPTPEAGAEVWVQELFDRDRFVHRLELYRDAAGQVWLRILDEKGQQLGSRFGTKAEGDLYDAFVAEEERLRARARLENHVLTLRRWAGDAELAGANWDSYTWAQKDAALKILIERTWKLLYTMADTLEATGLGE